MQPVPPVGRKGGRLRNERICKGATKGHQGKSRNEPPSPGQPPPGHSLPLCSQLRSHSSVSFQLRLVSSLAPSRDDLALPKSPFLWQPSNLTLQSNTPSSLISRLILCALLQLCPNPAFQGLPLCFPPPLAGPSPSSSLGSVPRGSGEQLGGLRSGTHRCRPGSVFGELQGEQRRLSGRAKHPVPRTTAHYQPHRSSLGVPRAHRAGGIPEHPQTAP